MIEELWLKSLDPQELLQHFGLNASNRKLRLFAVACCHRIENLVLRFRGAYRAVVLAERIADGAPFSDEARCLRQRIPEEAFGLIDGYRQEKENNTVWYAAKAAAGCLAGIIEPDQLWSWPSPALLDVPILAAHAASHWARRNDREPYRVQQQQSEEVAQVALLHCIFGNPFRPVVFFSDWRTDTVLSLARTMYESREFGTAPILADALQDAGCDSADLLEHLRDPHATHVRGCWALDLILGKE